MLHYAHIVTMLGTCTAHGSRVVLLSIHDNSQVYLSHRGFVHRDLAARNVLVKNDVAKVRVDK